MCYNITSATIFHISPHLRISGTSLLWLGLILSHEHDSNRQYHN